MLRLRRLMEDAGSLALLLRLVEARLSASKQTLGAGCNFCCWLGGFWELLLGGVDDGVKTADVLRSGRASYSQPRAPMSRRGSAEAFEPRRGSRGLRWWNRANIRQVESLVPQDSSFLPDEHFTLESSFDVVFNVALFGLLRKRRAFHASPCLLWQWKPHIFRIWGAGPARLWSFYRRLSRWLSRFFSHYLCYSRLNPAIFIYATRYLSCWSHFVGLQRWNRARRAEATLVRSRTPRARSLRLINKRWTCARKPAIFSVTLLLQYLWLHPVVLLSLFPLFSFSLFLSLSHAW